MSDTEILPLPDTAALAQSNALINLIKDQIQQNNGWLAFDKYMEIALYTPQYGYYCNGTAKFGAGGDFITAPVLSPLFGQTLARQLSKLLPQTAGNIYEFGAGDGQLATTLLKTIPDHLLKNYFIIELSSELSQRQYQYIEQQAPEHIHKVHYLHSLPDYFDGVILGNEILDAMPVPVYQRKNGYITEKGVSWENNQLIWKDQPVEDINRLNEIKRLFPDTSYLYQSELHPRQYAFIATLAKKLHQGAILLIDYGFDQTQYYHSQRHQGSLIGHYRHHSIHDVFFHPGLTDLTAHVNFTRIADAGVDNNLDLIGYTTQAHFLLNLGITELLDQIGSPEEAEFICAAAACHTLLNQHEMGELFKVMAFGKNIDVDWQGFKYGDLCHKL